MKIPYNEIMELVGLQDDLNHVIATRYEEQTGRPMERTLTKNRINITTELAEWMNEEAWIFKDWKHRTPNDHERRKKSAEEMADVLHFVLSMGIQLRAIYTIPQNFIIHTSESSLDPSELYLEILKNVLSIPNTNAILQKRQWFDVLFQFLMLAELLDFSWEQVYNAYKMKNTTNLERQKNGY